MKLQYFSQLDSRWSHIKLGSSNLSIGRWGCAYTSLVNLWMAMTGKQLTPKRYMEIAQDAKNFTDKNHPGGAGLILWDRVCEALGGVEFVGRGDAKAGKIISAIRSKGGDFVVVAVNKDSHFVSGWGVPADGSDVVILDPLGAKRVSIKKSTYKISSARYFRLK